MSPFKGFQEGRSRSIPMPVEFFTEILPMTGDPDELRLLLYAFWFLEKQEGTFRFIKEGDFSADLRFMGSLDQNPEQAHIKLVSALQKTLTHEIFLEIKPMGEDTVFVMNSPSGKAALQAVKKGTWSPSNAQRSQATLSQEKPNIFKLYEENIGTLTPLIAEDLKAAEQDYPQSWVEEAFRLAVQRNARSWRYIETILKRWKEHGRDDADQTGDQEDRRKYVSGKYGDIIKH